MTNAAPRRCLLTAVSILLGVAAPASARLGAPPPPELHWTEGIPYVSGGLGEFGREQAELVAAGHNLKLVFGLSSGAYLANGLDGLGWSASRATMNEAVPVVARSRRSGEICGPSLGLEMPHAPRLPVRERG